MEAAELVKTAYDVFAGKAAIPVEVVRPSLGMAYGIPKGTEDTVVESYAPWHRASISQSFERESSIFGAPLAVLTLVMNWRYSDALQYIINANLAVEGQIAWGTDVNVRVEFDQPSQYDIGWEAYEIPFHVNVLYDPIGDAETKRLNGVIRADGSGSFLG